MASFSVLVPLLITSAVQLPNSAAAVQQEHCAPGHYSDNGVCQLCPVNTFNSGGPATSCANCRTECASRRHARVISPCNGTHDLICECDAGYFAVNDHNQCLRFAVCQNGYSVISPGTPRSNTKCIKNALTSASADFTMSSSVRVTRDFVNKLTSTHPPDNVRSLTIIAQNIFTDFSIGTANTFVTPASKTPNTLVTPTNVITSIFFTQTLQYESMNNDEATTYFDLTVSEIGAIIASVTVVLIILMLLVLIVLATCRKRRGTASPDQQKSRSESNASLLKNMNYSDKCVPPLSCERELKTSNSINLRSSSSRNSVVSISDSASTTEAKMELVDEK